MKITLIFTGKTRISYIEEGLKEYLKRIKHYVPFEVKVLNDLKNTKNMTMEEQMSKEGDQIIRSVPAGNFSIILDEKGKEFESIAFAEFLQRRMIEGRDMCFIIGGPYGFSEKVYQFSDMKMSLSKLTFSHQMVRLIALEQIYRALTIIKGEPYHHS